jgi:ribose transport system substrate-binding protein
MSLEFGRSFHSTPISRFLLLVLCCALWLGCSKGSSEKKYRIAVIPQGSTHEYWKSIHAGAMKAAEDLGKQGVQVEIIWKGPMREDDREQQVQVVEGFLAQGINGIVLAPFDKDALVRPVEEAKRAQIPTVVIDSALASQDPVSFVASNNYHGGELAAEEMGRLLNGTGKVMVLRYQEGVSSTEAREKGFLDKIKAEFPKITVLSSNQHAGATRDTAKSAAENLLDRFGNEIQGIFTPNESSTAGTLLALEDTGRAEKIRFIGFDNSDIFVQAMKAKKLDGVVIQNPFRMGEVGVKTLVDYLQGKPIEKSVDTGVVVVTPANLDSPESQKLLHPPLEQYLK